jgi:hypothetical protein
LELKKADENSNGLDKEERSAKRGFAGEKKIYNPLVHGIFSRLITISSDSLLLQGRLSNHITNFY